MYMSAVISALNTVVISCAAGREVPEWFAKCFIVAFVFAAPMTLVRMVRGLDIG